MLCNLYYATICTDYTTSAYPSMCSDHTTCTYPPLCSYRAACAIVPAVRCSRMWLPTVTRAPTPQVLVAYMQMLGILKMIDVMLPVAGAGRTLALLDLTQVARNLLSMDCLLPSSAFERSLKRSIVNIFLPGAPPPTPDVTAQSAAQAASVRRHAAVTDADGCCNCSAPSISSPFVRHPPAMYWRKVLQLCCTWRTCAQGTSRVQPGHGDAGR
jgi:hypothetical protein